MDRRLLDEIRGWDHDDCDYGGKDPLNNFDTPNGQHPTEKKQGFFDENTTQRQLPYVAPETVSEPDFEREPAEVFTWGTCVYDLIVEGIAEFRTSNSCPDLLRDIHNYSTQKLVPLVDKISDCPPLLSALIDKAVQLDSTKRYSNMKALFADLEIVRHNPRLDVPQAIQIGFGNIDSLSRFENLADLLERDDQVKVLDREFGLVEKKQKSRIVCCYGESGTGKSKMALTWSHNRIRERTAGKRDVLVGWAKVSPVLTGHVTNHESC